MPSGSALTPFCQSYNVRHARRLIARVWGRGRWALRVSRADVAVWTRSGRTPLDANSAIANQQAARDKAQLETEKRASRPTWWKDDDDRSWRKFLVESMLKKG